MFRRFEMFRRCRQFSTLIKDEIPHQSHPDRFGSLAARPTKQYQDEDEITEVHDRLPLLKYSKMIRKSIKENRLSDAIDVLETKMKVENAKPDRYTYKLLISGCARLGYTQKAFQLFNQMKKRAIVPTLSIYTSLFNACANSPWQEDGLKRALDLKELILEKGVSPNQITYHSMIKAFGRCGDPFKAFSIVDEMTASGVPVTSETFNFLLQAAISDRQNGLKYAITVWRKLLSRNIKPTVFTYNLLLRCIRDCGLGEDPTVADIQQMISAQSVPRIESGDSVVSSVPAPNLLLPDPRLDSVLSLKKMTKSWSRISATFSTDSDEEAEE